MRMLERLREFPEVAALLARVQPHPEYDPDPWEGFCDPQVIVYTGPSWWRPRRPVAELRWRNAVAVLRLADGPDVDLVVDLDIDPADVLPDGTVLVSP
jgi:hypothetical protein